MGIKKSLKVQPTTDGDAFNAILRHPDVAPSVSLGGDVPDMALYVQDPANKCFMNEHGGFLFIEGPPTEYTVHTAFTKEGRGPYLLNAAKYAAKEVFAAGATVIKTFVADDNPAALRLAILTGFNKVARAKARGVKGDILLLKKDD